MVLKNCNRFTLRRLRLDWFAANFRRIKIKSKSKSKSKGGAVLLFEDQFR